MTRTSIQTAFSVASFIEAIRSSLGGDLINTELPDVAFTGAAYNPVSNPVLGLNGIIAQAILWYSRYCPTHRYRSVVLNGAKMYTITPQYYGFGIVEVYWPRENTILSLGGFSDPYLIWSGTYLRDIADVELALQYYETAEMLFGSSRVWQFEIDNSVDPALGRLYLSPDRQNTIDRVVYRYAMWHDLETIPFPDLDLFLAYARALARERIGLARRKFGQVPGENEGQQLDGSDMVSEAREDLNTLSERLRQRKGDQVPARYF